MYLQFLLRHVSVYSFREREYKWFPFLHRFVGVYRQKFIDFMCHDDGPDCKLSYGTLYKTIDAEMNAPGSGKNNY